MALIVGSSRIAGRVDEIPQLVALGGSAEWSLWVSPTDRFAFSAEDVGAIARAFSPLAGAVWSCESPRGHSQTLRERNRVFGRWPGLRGQVVSEETFRAAGTDGVVYSDIAKFDSGGLQSVSGLLSGNAAGWTSSLAFLPDSEAKVHSWARAVHGLLWLTLCREWIATTPEGIVCPDGVIRSYVRLCNHLSGIPGIVAHAHAAAKVLVFLGDREALHRASAILRETSDWLEDESLLNWLRRDVYLPFSP